MLKLMTNAKRLAVNCVIIGALFSACASCRIAPPRQTLCILNTSAINPAEWISDCFDTEGDPNGFTRPVGSMDKFVCRSDSDEQILEEWIKRLLISCDKQNASQIEKYELPVNQIIESLRGRNAN